MALENCQTLNAYSYGVATDSHRLPSTRLEKDYPANTPGSNFYKYPKDRRELFLLDGPPRSRPCVPHKIRHTHPAIAVAQQPQATELRYTLIQSGHSFQMSHSVLRKTTRPAPNNGHLRLRKRPQDPRQPPSGPPRKSHHCRSASADRRPFHRRTHESAVHPAAPCR